MKRDFLISLFSEKNDDGKYTHASIGRITFLIVLGIAVYIWVAGTGDIQASHMQMLYITATYNLMKKTTWFGSMKTPNSEMVIEHQAEDEAPPRI